MRRIGKLRLNIHILIKLIQIASDCLLSISTEVSVVSESSDSFVLHSATLENVICLESGHRNYALEPVSFIVVPIVCRVPPNLPPH